jgi:hypothetical protein
VSRNTVRKILRSGETEFSYERDVQPLPKIGPWQGDLDRLLLANDGKPASHGIVLFSRKTASMVSGSGEPKPSRSRSRVGPNGVL